MSRADFQNCFRLATEAREEERSYPQLNDFGVSIRMAEEIANESRQLEQLQGQLTAMLHLQDTLSCVKSASMEHLALVESTTLALGLSESTFPALESYAGGAISTEGLGDRVREIIAWIRKTISVIAEKIKSFFGMLAEDSAQLWIRLGLARDVYKELAGRFPRNPTVKLGYSAMMVAGPAGVPHDAKTLHNLGNNIDLQLRSLRTRYIPVLKKTGNDLAAAFGNRELADGNLNGWLDRLNRAASGLSFPFLAQVMNPLQRMVDDRYAANSAWLAPPILGGRAIVVLDGRVGHNGNTDMETALAIQNTKMMLIRPNQVKQIDISKAAMATMPINEIGTTLDLVEKLLKELDKAAEGNIRGELDALDRQLGNVISSASNLDRGIGKVQIGVNFGSAFTTWCSAPYLNLLSHTLSVSSALIATASKHMAAY